MDPGHPDGKRARLSSWSASTAQGASLPPPLPAAATAPRPHPPPAPPAHLHQPHPAPPSYQQQSPSAPLSAPLSSHAHHNHHHHQLAPQHNHSLGHAIINQNLNLGPDHGHGHGHNHHHPADLERRHHDQETLAPMQDPYRQPPHSHQPPPPPPLPPSSQHSPSPTHHHPYPPYSSRDSAIRRDSGQDLRRPNSTGHAPDPLTPIAHHSSAPQPAGPPPPPAAYAPDAPPRHMTYEAGPPMPHAAFANRPPSYPPTPTHQQTSYEPHSAYPSAVNTAYGVYPSGSSAKKKNTRASQACDQCRQLKAKCDETKPCKTCRDKGTECRYRDPVPKATDKAQADILDGIITMQNSLSSLVGQVDMMNSRITRLESSLTRFSSNGNAKVGLNDHAKPALSSPDDMRRLSRPPPMAENTTDNHCSPPRVACDQALEHGPPLQVAIEDDMEPDPGPPVPPGEPAIPINHTTLAGLLLEWPPIREMTKHHVQGARIHHVGEFPIGPELNRGSLIVHGRGEDAHRPRHRAPNPDYGHVEIGDDGSNTASPSPAADWGRLGGFSPDDHQVEYRGGALGIDGSPDFSESKVWEYAKSFNENILNMHPVIEVKTVEEWVRQFLDSLPKTQHATVPKHHTFQAGFASVSGCQAAAEQTGSKRKRSPIPDASEGLSSSKAGRPERSIHSALVLTVLALGKVCLYRERVPDALHHGDAQPMDSPLARNGLPPSPVQGSPPSHSSSHSHASSLASPREQERGGRSRPSSIRAPAGGVRAGYGLKKNFEVIPGLEYFAMATDILGNYIGAYKSMKNVYANIFAGLYQGQLGRPIESFAFIHQAGHKLQVIMRPSLDKLRRLKHEKDKENKPVLIQDPKYNQLALAFWTCLQLESDLIAEMNLPPSGLLSYENDMPLPNMMFFHDTDQRIVNSYLGQLYLRTHLNGIHRLFYSPEESLDPDQQRQIKLRNVHRLAQALEDGRWMGSLFAFSNDDPPADDILSARLRGKYWGAQVITYRPFVRMILEYNHSRMKHSSSPQMANYHHENGIFASSPGDSNAMDQIDSRAFPLAEKGIKALIESTRAFHGLGELRPIITNVFGTAHAQWGNCLVLAAAFRDPDLGRLVDEDLLRRLFARTIAFLRQSATSTSALAVDRYILEGLYKDLFGHDAKTHSSFSSSSASMHTPKLPMAAPPLTNVLAWSAQSCTGVSSCADGCYEWQVMGNSCS